MHDSDRLAAQHGPPVVGRMDDNEAIFKRILDDPEFQATLMDMYASKVYRRARQEP